MLSLENGDLFPIENWEQIWESWAQTFKNPIVFKPISSGYTRHIYIWRMPKAEWEILSAKQKIYHLISYFSFGNFFYLQDFSSKSDTIYILKLDILDGASPFDET